MRTSSSHARRGFTLIELLIICVVIAILAAIALPNFAESNKAANESSAISSMRALVAAEENYRVSQSQPKYAVLSQLKAAGLINPVLGSGSKNGYTFLTFGIPDKDSYAFTGQPQSNRGERYFYVDQTGVIRSSKGDMANSTSPPIQ